MIRIKNLFRAPAIALALFSMASTHAQTGPFSPENWPPTGLPDATVHFISVDDSFTPFGSGWISGDLSILSGGDQGTQPIDIGGHKGLKVTGNYLNIADGYFQEWDNFDVIDILMQVYGNEALLGAGGVPRNFNFLTGTLPEVSAPVGGSIPVEAKNLKWNWVLFRIPNGFRASDGTHFVGSIPENAQGATQAGGVNGGTIRMQTVPGLIVRVVAFGQEGAFGEPDEINVFAPADTCDPEPATNHASLSIAANQENHLVLISNGDQTVTIQDNVGPAGDKRRAARPDGLYINFGITDNYFGKPCNDPRTMKLCVEFYDDPELAGTVFGPEAYATDAVRGVGIFPAARRHTLLGTGQWIRRSFTVSDVNLRGVNTGSMTGGPRLAFEGGQVFISAVDLAILRVGEHPLANQDPLANCVEDLNICTGAYGSFVELDLAKGIQNGLAPGSSGGDQVMIEEEAGPDNDRRLAIRAAHNDGTPGFPHIYMNFAITDEAMGPSSQPNTHLAICVTYYDDPDLIGATFRPEVFQTDRGGQTTLGFTPGNTAVPLEGTGEWREAYFEIPEIKFNGVNQGPQAAARFVTSGKVFFSRVRYAVIRPCGDQAGVNLLEDCKPAGAPTLSARIGANRSIRLAWPANATGFILEQTTDIGSAAWEPANLTPTVEGEENVVTLQPTSTRFYRLVQ
jgi:hypothetical protein